MKLRLLFGAILTFLALSSFIMPEKSRGVILSAVEGWRAGPRTMVRHAHHDIPMFLPGAPAYRMAKLKYNGGGDWYGDRTALPNLIKFCNENLHTNFQGDDEVVEVGSAEIFNYPFVFMTGHGNVIFNDAEVRNLRKYLTGGGFLHICDNYGLDQFIRPQMKKVFPELDFVELPLNHPIYHQKFDFPNGLPKIHEHDGKRPQGFGLIYRGRLVCFYDYECDLGNGWEDYGTYAGDSQDARTKALKMGANMIQYVLTQ